MKQCKVVRKNTLTSPNRSWAQVTFLVANIGPRLVTLRPDKRQVMVLVTSGLCSLIDLVRCLSF